MSHNTPVRLLGFVGLVRDTSLDKRYMTVVMSKTQRKQDVREDKKVLLEKLWHWTG